MIGRVLPDGSSSVNAAEVTPLVGPALSSKPSDVVSIEVLGMGKVTPSSTPVGSSTVVTGTEVIVVGTVESRSAGTVEVGAPSTIVVKPFRTVGVEDIVKVDSAVMPSP